jgi:hypothetical protein
LFEFAVIEDSDAGNRFYNQAIISNWRNLAGYAEKIDEAQQPQISRSLRECQFLWLSEKTKSVGQRWSNRLLAMRRFRSSKHVRVANERWWSVLCS